MYNLNSKVALVTGSNQGIGEGIALELACVGVDVVITHLNNLPDAKKANFVVNKIMSKGRKSIALPLDITDRTSITRCVESSLESFGKLDILVNNAGISQRRQGFDISGEEFDLCYEVNLKGVWLVCEHVTTHFKERKEGKIINIASIAGRKGHNQAPAYCATKAGVISLTQSLATELGPYNINVNAICPGSIWTPMYEEIEKKYVESSENPINLQKTLFEQSIDLTPLGRPQNPEDIGRLAAFLCSDHARNITGQTINVDGGLLMN